MGVVPRRRLGDARRIRRRLEEQPGFAECGLDAIIVVVRDGFGICIVHPPDEPIPDGFPREIEGVPISTTASRGA